LDHRKFLLEQLEAYKRSWQTPREAPPGKPPFFVTDVWERFVSFVNANPDCFKRSLLSGHITASALITSPCFRHVLLLHHAKLDKWLQLGGHADGNPDTYQVALKEAYEESGLAIGQIEPASRELNRPSTPDLSNRPFLFDIDIHEIPETKTTPAHEHYDVRYLFIADRKHALKPNHEAKDLRWFSLNEAFNLTTEKSMHRLFHKLADLQTSQTIFKKG
jgi:8-oxo-dGTP pyrophosphatase MutT (NUDIX family)